MRTVVDIIILLALCCVLLACATEPQVSTVTNTVYVRVPTPCIEAGKIPLIPKPTPIDLVNATHDQVDAANAADLKLMDQYAAEADPVLKACARAASAPTLEAPAK